MAIKTVSMYEVRYYPSDASYSKNVGRKCRLLPFRSAQAVVRRLKKAGVDAFVGQKFSIVKAA